jgi:hypothetical protein
LLVPSQTRNGLKESHKTSKQQQQQKLRKEREVPKETLLEEKSI